MNFLDPYTTVGLVGMVLILFSIYRTAIGKWTHHSILYELDHAVGSLLLIVYLYHERAYIGIVIHTAYFLVSFKGISSYAERRVKKRKKKNT